MGVSVGILGASGYAGAELVRLCAQHPAFELVALGGERAAGAAVAEYLPHVSGHGRFVDNETFLGQRYDAVFCCLPSGSGLPTSVEADLVIDLSDEHRSDPDWSYGLAELTRVTGPSVANPGCYPTAALLALVPFVRAGLIDGPVIVDAISGLSGAGRKPEDRLLFTDAHANVTAYGTTDHRHVTEIERGLLTLGGADLSVSFTPHLAPLARGLLVTARARLVGPATEGHELEVLRAAYDGSNFVRVIEGWPGVKPVIGSNAAVVSARVDARTGYLIASAGIDNLGKGAAGQAVQNANLVLGLDETAGLSSFGMWP